MYTNTLRKADGEFIREFKLDENRKLRNIGGYTFSLGDYYLLTFDRVRGNASNDPIKLKIIGITRRPRGYDYYTVVM